MPPRHHHLPAVTAGIAALVVTGTAWAQPGQIVSTVAAPAGYDGGVVTQATGAGGLLTGGAPGLVPQLDQALGGGRPRPTGPPAAGPEAGGGAGGTGGGQPQASGQGGPVMDGEVLEFALVSLRAIGAAYALDYTAPRIRGRALSTIRDVRRDGRLRLLLRIDEPAVVALRTNVRPGRRARRATGRHSRNLIRVPPTMLAFRRRGSLRVDVRLDRDARRRLGRSRDARVQLLAIAVDAGGTQAPVIRKLHVRR